MSPGSPTRPYPAPEHPRPTQNDATSSWAWQRCDATGSACATLDGPTTATYRVTPADVGSTIRVLATVIGPDGTALGASAPTAVVVAAPAVELGSPAAAPGGTVTVTGTGFAPNTTVTVELHPTAVALGTATTDDDGTFTATFTVPGDATAGDHQVVVSGADVAGNPSTVSVAFEVTTLEAPPDTPEAPTPTAPNPDILDTDETPAPLGPAGPDFATDRGPSSYGDRLPVTGAPLATVLVAGLGLLAAGATMRAGSRPRR